MSREINHDKRNLIVKASLPAFLAFIYSIYKYYELGFSEIYFLDTYILFFGSFASYISITQYLEITNKVGIINFIRSISGLIPPVFSLYIIIYLGFIHLWGLINQFEIWELIKGLFWVFMGYRMGIQFWLITELKKEKLI